MEPRADRRSLGSVLRDARLLRHEAAEAARMESASQLDALWSRFSRYIGDLPPDDLASTRRSFAGFCDAAARRRIRQRQILVVAYAVIALVSAVPTVWVIILAVGSARPSTLIAYVLTTLALALPAWFALRTHRLISAALVAAIAGLVCWVVWQRPAVGTWWDPRTMMLTPATDRQPVVGGFVLGVALAVLLIVLALTSAVALVLVSRSRQGGGTSDVRAFDHLIAVVELLVRTDRRPGDDRRRRIEESLRTAEVALLLMARGGRPVGAHGRLHRRELRTQQRKIVQLLRGPNPLRGLREVDDAALAAAITCMIAICRDQLGDVLKSIEEAPKKSARRMSVRSRTRIQQLLGMILPLATFLALLHFDFPIPAPAVGLLATFCALVVVFGVFWLVFPGQRAFFAGVSRMARFVVDAIPAPRQPEDAGDDPAADTGTDSAEPGNAPAQRSPSAGADAVPGDPDV